MGKVNYAAIDIGSNAVRLLIKSIDREAVQEKKIKKVMMLRVPLRLGFDVFSIGELSEKKADKLRRLMKAFRQLMKIYDVDDYRACATSAMRDARNGRTIIKKIEKDTGIRIEIIDGQEEARMIYNNHIECMEDRLGNYMYVDVGGGSTEINLLTNGELVWSVSYNIGTVRMLSNAVKEGTWQQMEEELMFGHFYAGRTQRIACRVDIDLAVEYRGGDTFGVKPDFVGLAPFHVRTVHQKVFVE